MRFLPSLTRPTAPNLALGAFFFLFTICFVPGISGVATTPRWALLSIAVPIGLVCIEPPRLTLGHLLLGLYLAWTALSYLWTPGYYEGADELWKLALFAGLFLIGGDLQSLKPIAIGIGLGFAVNSGFVIAQGFDYVPVPVIDGPTGRTAGLFANRNNSVEAGVLAMILVIGHRLWWLVPGILPSIFWLVPGLNPAQHRIYLPSGLGPLLSFGGAVAMWIAARWRLAAIAMLFVLLGGATAVLTIRPNNSLTEHMTIWRDTARGLKPLGNGIGSFYVGFAGHAKETNTVAGRPSHAHNDFLEIAYETGIPGIALWLGFLGFALAGAGTVERLIVITIMMEACFAFPLSFPLPATLAALAAGRLCRDRLPLRDALDAGRVSLVGWLVALGLYPRGAGTLPAGGETVPARSLQ